MELYQLSRDLLTKLEKVNIETSKKDAQSLVEHSVTRNFFYSSYA